MDRPRCADPSSPSAVLSPVLLPPCIRHLGFFIAGDRHGLPLRVRAPQRGEDCANGSVVRQSGRRSELRHQSGASGIGDVIALTAPKIDWGSFLLRAVSHPPDPALVGDRWLPMSRQRLENVPLFWKAGCGTSDAPN